MSFRSKYCSGPPFCEGHLIGICGNRVRKTSKVAHSCRKKFFYRRSKQYMEELLLKVLLLLLTSGKLCVILIKVILTAPKTAGAMSGGMIFLLDRRKRIACRGEEFIEMNSILPSLREDFFAISRHAGHDGDC